MALQLASAEFSSIVPVFHVVPPFFFLVLILLVVQVSTIALRLLIRLYTVYVLFGEVNCL